MSRFEKAETGSVPPKTLETVWSKLRVADCRGDGAIRHFALESAQCPQLTTSDRVDTGHPALTAAQVSAKFCSSAIGIDSWTVATLHIEEAMMSNARAAATAAAKPLEFQVMSGCFALAGNQPANYTLVKGETEALLIDVPFSRSDAHRVVAAILDSDKKLTTIFVTHDHPDHFFSLDLLIESFPNAQIVAHAVVAKDMERSIPLKFQRWTEGIGANAPRRGVVPTALPGDEITLEGHTLKILGPMQGDHIHCTALWDADTRTLVAGDLVYNGAFVFLGEHLAPQYAEWLASLDYLESLNPVRVIAGHTKPGLPDDSFAIDWTRGYIRAFAKAAKIAKSSREMAAMLHALYPNAVNFPGTEFLVEVPTQVATGEIPPWNE